jgi:hypothetical protein
MTIEQHLSRSENKTLKRWGALGNKPPWKELQAILHDMGCYSEEIPRVAAERALIRWVKKNQLRMRQEIKEQTRGDHEKPAAPAVVLPLNRDVRRKMRLNEQLAPKAFLAAFKPSDATLDDMRVASELRRADGILNAPVHMTPSQIAPAVHAAIHDKPKEPA